MMFNPHFPLDTLKYITIFKVCMPVPDFCFPESKGLSPLSFLMIYDIYTTDFFIHFPPRKRHTHSAAATIEERIAVIHILQYPTAGMDARIRIKTILAIISTMPLPRENSASPADPVKFSGSHILT